MLWEIPRKTGLQICKDYQGDIFYESKFLHLLIPSSVQFSHSVMSDSLWLHVLQHARLPCPSLSPRVCSNSGQKMPSNHLILCHPLLILPSIFPSLRIFSDESALHSGWPKYRASASVLPVNIQGWFPLGWTGWISLLEEELSSVFPSTTTWKHQSFRAQSSLRSNSHIHTWLLGKPQLWLYEPLSAELNVSGF